MDLMTQPPPGQSDSGACCRRKRSRRTGTYEESAAANDVGIITLQGRSGHIAIAVFVKASRLNPAGRERVMARIARTVYHF